MSRYYEVRMYPNGRAMFELRHGRGFVPLELEAFREYCQRCGCEKYEDYKTEGGVRIIRYRDPKDVEDEREAV